MPADDRTPDDGEQSRPDDAAPAGGAARDEVEQDRPDGDAAPADDTSPDDAEQERLDEVLPARGADGDPVEASDDSSESEPDATAEAVTADDEVATDDAAQDDVEQDGTDDVPTDDRDADADVPQDLPADGAAREQGPAEEPQVAEVAADEPPTDEVPADEAPADEVAADEAPADAGADEPAVHDVVAPEAAMHGPETSAEAPVGADAEPVDDVPTGDDAAVAVDEAVADGSTADEARDATAPGVAGGTTPDEDRTKVFDPVVTAPHDAFAAPAPSSTPAEPVRRADVRRAAAREERSAGARPAAVQVPAAGAAPRGPLDDFESRPEPRRWPRALGITLAVLVVLAGAYVGAAWLLGDRVPSGATVAGVEIGGLSEEEAVERLRTSLQPVAESELPVAAAEMRTTLDPVEAGMRLDAEATVEPLVGFGLEPARLWRQVFGMAEVDPVTIVDDAAFDVAFADLMDALRAEPVDGTVVFVDGDPETTPAEQGSEVDPEPGRQALLDGWLTAARPLELPTRPLEPDISDEDVQLAMREIARPLADAPVSVSVSGQLAQLPADVTTAAAELVPEEGRLVLRLDGEALAEAVVDRTTDLLADAKDASFTFTDGVPTIVPGVPGKTIDPDALAEAVAEAATGSDRTATIELVDLDPEQTTEALEALGIKEKVAEFSTGSLGTADRVHNLTLGASKVNGTLIRPGEVFSLNDTLAPITREGGYRGASVVVNGVLQQGVGGGLSQMGTTVYNAGFFAGLEDVEHRPHSYYFSRYPEGREATIYGDVLDVKIGNNTPYGVLFQSWVSGGRLHVAIWSTKHWTVEHWTSGRSNVVQPKTIYNTSAGCISQGAGSPGFSVTVGRRLLLDGEVKHEETNSWRYQPQNRIVCGAPPSDDDEDAED